MLIKEKKKHCFYPVFHKSITSFLNISPTMDPMKTFHSYNKDKHYIFLMFKLKANTKANEPLLSWVTMILKWRSTHILLEEFWVHAFHKMHSKHQLVSLRQKQEKTNWFKQHLSLQFPSGIQFITMFQREMIYFTVFQTKVKKNKQFACTVFYLTVTSEEFAP